MKKELPLHPQRPDTYTTLPTITFRPLLGKRCQEARQTRSAE